MKPLLIAVALAFAAVTHATAADMPPGPAPEVPPVYYKTTETAYNWTGFYLGINGGYAFGTSNWYNSGFGTGTGDFTANGFLAGGTVGANYQSGVIVYGIEADGDWSNLDGSARRLLLRRNLRNQKRLARHRARPHGVCVGPPARLRHGGRRLQ